MQNIRNEIQEVINNSEDGVVNILDLQDIIDGKKTASLKSKDLIEMLEGLGHNPIDEPEIYDILEEMLRPSKVFKLALKTKKFKLDDYDPMEIAVFARKAVDRVRSLHSEDGSFKSTENTENCKIITVEQREDLYDELMGIVDKRTTLEAEQDTAKRLEGIKEITKQADAINKKCLKMSGLKVKDLTEWEKILVQEMIKKASIDLMQYSGN